MFPIGCKLKAKIPIVNMITAFLACRLSFFSITYLLAYLLTPWCRVLLEKLTGLQLVKKFPAFHGTRRFITALTSVHHLSLSWTIPNQSIYDNTTFLKLIALKTLSDSKSNSCHP